MSSRIADELRGLPRQFWLLTCGTFVYSAGIFLAYPFEALYLNGSLGIPMTTVGLLIGVMSLAGLPFQFPGGAAADRIGRRPVLALAIAGSMTLCVGLALSRALWLVALVIFVEAAFGWSMYLTSSHAMIADLVARERRAEALSIVRVAINAGSAVGPLLAAPILASSGYRASFLAGAAVCGLFLLIVIFAIRETRPGGDSTDRPVQSDAATASDQGEPAIAGLPKERRHEPGYGSVLRDRRFLAFCGVMLLPLYALGQLWISFPVVMGDVHRISPERWGVLAAVFSTTAMVLQYPLVRGLRNRDPLRVLAVASIFLAGSLSGAVFAPGGWPSYALVATASVGFLLMLPIGTGVVSRLAPVELRGRYLGVWTFAYLVGYNMGPLLGGAVLDALGPHGAYLVVAGTGLGGAALLLALGAAFRLRDRSTVATSDA
jgi:MFS family permease